MKLQLRIWRARLSDRVPQWIANHLPRKVVYFAGIRMWAAATTGEYGNTNAVDVTADEVIRRWDLPKELNES